MLCLKIFKQLHEVQHFRGFHLLRTVFLLVNQIWHLLLGFGEKVAALIRKKDFRQKYIFPYQGSLRNEAPSKRQAGTH